MASQNQPSTPLRVPTMPLSRLQQDGECVPCLFHHGQQVYAVRTPAYAPYLQAMVASPAGGVVPSVASLPVPARTPLPVTARTPLPVAARTPLPVAARTPLPAAAPSVAPRPAAVSGPSTVPASAPVAAPPQVLLPAPAPAVQATMAPFRGSFKTRHEMLTAQDRLAIEQDLLAATNSNDFIDRIATRFPMWQWNLSALPVRVKNPPKWSKAEILLLVHEWEYGIFAEGSWARGLAARTNKFSMHSWVLRRLTDWGFTGRSFSGVESMKSHIYKNDWHNSPGLKTMARQLVSEGVDTSDLSVGHAGELIIRVGDIKGKARGNDTLQFGRNPHAW